MSKPDSVLIIDPAQELKFKGKRRKVRKKVQKSTESTMGRAMRCEVNRLP